MICKDCGVDNSEGARFCEGCGASLAPKPKICSACGANNRPTARFCSECGSALESPATGAALSPSVPSPSTPVTVPALTPAKVYAGPTTDEASSARKDASPPPVLDPHPAPAPGLLAGLRIIRGVAILLALLVLVGLYLALVPDGSSDSTSDPAARVLGLIALAWSIGGALAAAVLLDRLKARYAVAAGLGVAAALLYNSAPVRPVTGHLLADLLLGGVAGAAVAGLATWISVSWTWGFDGPAIRRWLRQLLLPRNWPQGPKPGELSSKQLVTRWFVTIAASTGSVVGALAAQPRFWDAAGEALAPKRILFTLLLMVVSITLIGPLE